MAAPHVLAALPPTGAAAYVGADWLLYVDASAHYVLSEMVAPCLLLAQPGTAIQVLGQGGQPSLSAPAIFHAPGALSSGHSADHGAAFLYLDPLSAAGRCVAQRCAAPGFCACPGLLLRGEGGSDRRALGLGRGLGLGIGPGVRHGAGSEDGAEAWSEAWSEAWFAALRAGHADRSAVAQWVGSLRQALTAFAPAAALDRRIHRVGSLLSQDLAGRLSVAELAAHVHWSPEHLRKEFRAAAGMGLSKYQMWCRLHRMVEAAGGVAPDRRQCGSAESVLLDAGFYDAPHGSRAVRRFFGLTAGAALQPGISRADCRGL